MLLENIHVWAGTYHFTLKHVPESGCTHKTARTTWWWILMMYSRVEESWTQQRYDEKWNTIYERHRHLSRLNEFILRKWRFINKSLCVKCILVWFYNPLEDDVNKVQNMMWKTFRNSLCVLLCYFVLHEL